MIAPHEKDGYAAIHCTHVTYALHTRNQRLALTQSRSAEIWKLRDVLTRVGRKLLLHLLPDARQYFVVDRHLSCAFLQLYFVLPNFKEEDLRQA